MLRRNKSLSIIMALCLCLALLAPVFVAPPAAQAMSTATVVDHKFVGQAPDQNLGTIKVVVSDWESFVDETSSASPQTITVGYPTKLSGATAYDAPFLGTDITYSLPANTALTDADIELYGTDFGYGPQAVYGSFNVKITGFSGASDEDAVFYLHFKNIDTTNFAGDVNIDVVSSGGVFSDSLGLKLATVNATGKTISTIKSVRKVPSGGEVLDMLSIIDLVPGSIKAQGGNIILEMESKGFYFVDPEGSRDPLISGKWAFQDYRNSGTIYDDGDKIKFAAPDKIYDVSQEKGFLSIVNVGVAVDEKVARVGQDIEVRVKGPGVTEQTLVVGQYVDYAAAVTQDKTTELVAGQEDQYIGTFFIEEVAPGTLVEGRTIMLELPAGVEWQDYDPSEKNNTMSMTGKREVVNNSSIEFSEAQFIDAKTLKFTVTKTSENAQEGAKVLIKKLKVKVSPSQRGDITLKVSGKAGVEGEVVVSNVVPMITLEADTPKVVLGVKEQKVGDVIVTETKADALIDEFDGYATALKFYLDEGYRFSKVPKVEVLEGDVVLELDDVKITTPRSGQNLLIIPIRAGSYKTPAKIKISDIYVTADRTAPTGKVGFYAAETGADFLNDLYLSDYANAFNDTGRFIYDRAADCDVADNATVPPVENEAAGSGTFVIGSNIYTVNGVTRVMDVAPYIKNDRTYVPYRYLAYVLGVAEENVVWDQAAQTVTLTKGDNTVVATIGSTTMTVNGEAVVMDVAPEITNDRTMLPARWLAEALGATVGWDPASRTVVVEF